MKNPRKSFTDIARRAWNTLTKSGVTEVPDEIGCCEFDCRHPQCEQGKWESCERRLR